MGNVVRRRLGDATISLIALVILLVMLASVDDRVREQVSAVMGTHGSSQLAGASQEISGLVATVFDAVKYQSVSHAPMVIFALVATVLVVFMVRT
jgi:membrane associated rhomboid family serine protease